MTLYSPEVNTLHGGMNVLVLGTSVLQCVCSTLTVFSLFILSVI